VSSAVEKFVDAGNRALDRVERAFHLSRNVVQRLISYRVGRALGLMGEIFRFGCDDGKATAGLAGAS